MPRGGVSCDPEGRSDALVSACFRATYGRLMGRAPCALSHAALSLVLAAGCSPEPPGPSAAGSSPSAASTSSPPILSPTGPAPTQTPVATPTLSTTPRPTMNARAALRDIVHLASETGPREATSRNFTDAARFVQTRFERLGYDVRLTKVRVPSGVSWGTPVRSGTSVNVIAEPKNFDARKPYVVVGAHLDTVPVAPGAEDNASGIAVMLQLAAMVSQQPASVPVQFIAFGAEEPVAAVTRFITSARGNMWRTSAGRSAARSRRWWPWIVSAYAPVTYPYASRTAVAIGSATRSGRRRVEPPSPPGRARTSRVITGPLRRPAFRPPDSAAFRTPAITLAATCQASSIAASLIE